MGNLGNPHIKETWLLLMINSDVVLLQCKEKMRPMRKSLNAMDSPDVTLTPSERKVARRQCLVAIGRHIDHCLTTVPDPEKWHG